MVMTIVLWTAAVLIAAVLLCMGVTAFVAWRIERAVRPIGKTIEVDGATIHYVDEGSGPPIVLVHGLGGQLRHWTYETVDRLKQDYRVIAFDRPGYGYSRAVPGRAPTLRNQATMIADLIRALRLERPLLVGHSLGGALSLAVALDHREMISGLALVAPLTHPVETPPDAFVLMATLSPIRRWLTSWILATPLSLLFGKRAIGQVFGPDSPKPDFGVRGGNFLMLRPASFRFASEEMTAAPEDIARMERAYERLDCPVGVLYGREDRILDPRTHGEALVSKVPGATLTYVEGGHMPPQVRPDVVVTFIREMAARCAAL